MKVSDQIKAAGFPSVKALALVLQCTPACLRDWEKNRPERFRILLAGAVECQRVEKMRERLQNPDSFYAEVFARVDDDKKTTFYAVFNDRKLRTMPLDSVPSCGSISGMRWHDFHGSVPASAVSWGFYSYREFLS